MRAGVGTAAVPPDPPTAVPADGAPPPVPDAADVNQMISPRPGTPKPNALSINHEPY